LLVEDDAELVDILDTGLGQDLFAEHGHKLEEVTRAIHGNVFDLILLDLGIPGCDGFELLRRLKNDSASQHVPIIVVTAKNSMEDKLLGFELGAVDYVTKPFDVVELRAGSCPLFEHSVCRRSCLKSIASSNGPGLRPRKERAPKRSSGQHEP
jgi:putative two-component system response regulator